MTPLEEVLWQAPPPRRWLSRAAAFFVEPAPHDARPAAAATAMPHPSVTSVASATRAAALGRREHVPAAGAALAGELRAQSGARAAAVLLWDPQAPPHVAVDGPAAPAARALARAAEAEDVATEVFGLLARVRLPDDPSQAVAMATRLSDRLRNTPMVLALAGPRTCDFDVLLREQDLVTLVASEDEEPALIALARAGLEDIPATVITVPAPSGVARALALAGLGRAGAARRQSNHC
jgi:hypothetical protein